jgi:hypothetical protein
VFPAEWSDVGQQRVGQNFALDAKLGDGAAEIDGVPEGDGGDREVETRGPVALIFERAVPEVDEALGKTGLPLDLGEQFGSPDARQYAVEAPCDIIDIRVVLPDRADRQPRLGNQRLGKFACRGECGHFPEPPLEGLESLVAPSVKAFGDREPQLTSLSLSRERGGRQQEVVESPEGPAALDPDISGTKQAPPPRQPPRCDGQ